jgi:hypothetical protein
VKKLCVVAVALVWAGLVASPAWAAPKGGEQPAGAGSDEARTTTGQKKPRAPRGVITLDTVTIKGRLQQPIAAIDVARLRPRLTLSELRQPFVDRIGKAVYNAPF